MEDFSDIFGNPQESNDFVPFALVEINHRRMFVVSHPINTDDGILSIVGAWWEDYLDAEGDPESFCMILARDNWSSVTGYRWDDETMNPFKETA